MAAGGEQEIDSRTIQIESKRFYIDIKENARGRFMKVTEVSPDGIKQRILMTIDVSIAFRDVLADFVQSSRTLVASPFPNGQEGLLKSEMITRDVRRRYYVDLKENRRGRFVRVSQVSTSTREREQIAVPAPDGITQLHTAIDELLRNLGATQQPLLLPEATSLRLDRGKTIYFDVGSNEREVFLTLSEVRNSSRNSIVLPQRCWRQFRDTLDSYIAKCPAPGEVSLSQAPSSAAAAAASAPGPTARPSAAATATTVAAASNSTEASAVVPVASVASRVAQNSNEASSRTTSEPDSPARAAACEPASGSASASASPSASATASPDECESRFSDARDH